MSVPQTPGAGGTPKAASDLLHQWIRSIPDWPVSGVTFRDLSPLFANATAFNELIGHLADAGAALGGVDAVVGIEARGFILGAPVADRLNAGFVPMRKAGKLPGETVAESYALEYGEATIEMHTDALSAGENVLIVDDVLATGGTLAAAGRLVSQSGATHIGSVVAIELVALAGRNQLRGVPLTALTEF